MSDDRFLRQDPNPVPIDQLKQPDYDVREFREDADIENIRKALEEDGQLMPLLLGEQENGQYPILDGNHRYLAAKRLGWPALDCIHVGGGLSDDKAQIIANITRLELTQAEKLSVFDYMLNVLEMDQTTAAKEVGFDRSQVTRYASILTGYGEIKEFFVQGELGVHACYQLNMLEDRDRAVDIAQTAVREGYTDKDVIAQAKWARGDEEGKDEMRGAGSERNAENLQQVRRNAQAIQELEPTDQQAIQDAQVGAEGGPEAGEGVGSGEGGDAPQGPPCVGCGEPTEPGHMIKAQLHPSLAEQVGAQELGFGAECSGKLLEWWMERQEQTGATGGQEGAEGD